MGETKTFWHPISPYVRLFCKYVGVRSKILGIQLPAMPEK